MLIETDLLLKGSFVSKLAEVEEQNELLYSSNELTNIERWYENIKPYTFETSLIKLTVDEAKAIKFCYEYFSSFRQYEIETEGKEKGIGVNLYYDDEKYEEKYGQSFDWRLALNSNINKDDDCKENNNNKDEYKIHLENLNNLSNKINNIIDEMKCNDGIFIKLSRRSPKDSANESLKMFKILNNELSQKCDGNFKLLTNEQIVESYFFASIKSLCVYNGDEAISLFTTSYRIWKDLSLSILKQDAYEFNISVIIRSPFESMHKEVMVCASF